MGVIRKKSDQVAEAVPDVTAAVAAPAVKGGNMLAQLIGKVLGMVIGLIRRLIAGLLDAVAGLVGGVGKTVEKLTSGVRGVIKGIAKVIRPSKPAPPADGKGSSGGSAKADGAGTVKRVAKKLVKRDNAAA